MKVVLDTNVLIAAALQGGFAESIIDMANENLLTLITSEDILNELGNKLRNKFGWKKTDVDFFVTRIRKLSYVVKVTQRVSAIIRDPDDNKILECALSGKADLIVSADQDLIKLKTFEGIGIIHPKTLAWTFPKHFKKKAQRN
ncbi:MAG: hypothetical protein US51_C0003G0007 [Microgenomates group bacterium GW2011_GWA2_37_6]|nr:MAG: hypothetical protein US51_C0003G0007 [Microgenomates group bacterium GW2011_GWA2_37_6]